MSWSIRVIIMCVVIVFLVGIGSLWWGDGISAVDKSDNTTITFSVKPGESIRSIASRLASERIVRSRTVFFLLIKIMGIDNNVQAGDFLVKRSMPAEEIATALTRGAIDVWVTTLEGWRIEEIATKLTEELKIPGQEFIALAHEGYMFPDTYLLPKSASAAAVVEIFQANFDKRVTPDMRAQAANVGLTFEEVIILASLVEREGRTAEDRQVIAGILLNRLNIGMSLDVDATLQYVIGYDVSEKTWWKKGLTNEDKKINSPYNTYKNPGLPPAPISNPGLVSIKAVLSPQESEYLFYLHDAEGQIHYAKTLADHEANIAKYLQ